MVNKNEYIIKLCILANDPQRPFGDYCPCALNLTIFCLLIINYKATECNGVALSGYVLFLLQLFCHLCCNNARLLRVFEIMHESLYTVSQKNCIFVSGRTS